VAGVVGDHYLVEGSGHLSCDPDVSLNGTNAKKGKSVSVSLSLSLGIDPNIVFSARGANKATTQRNGTHCSVQIGLQGSWLHDSGLVFRANDQRLVGRWDFGLSAAEI
jgi:hypothetical protein